MMTGTKWVIPLVFSAIIICCASISCFNKQKSPPLDFSSVQSYREIPGVTPEEIEAIEKIKKERGKLIYGMIPSTEAFINSNGVSGINAVGGYAALFCEWLSGLFDIPFQLEILPTNVLLSKLNETEIDFSGNMMPTEERYKTYFMTDAIAERQFVAIRLAGSREFGQILLERPLR